MSLSFNKGKTNYKKAKVRRNNFLALNESLNNYGPHGNRTGVVLIGALWTDHYITVPSEELLSKSICSKLSGIDGDGWVACCGLAEENKADCRINELKPFTAADKIPCRSSGDIGKLGVKADTVDGDN